MLSVAKHPSLINIAETLRQAQGDNTPLMPPGYTINAAGRCPVILVRFFFCHSGA